MKYDFLILSSLPVNSGCFLRAKYLARSLEKNGAKIKLVIPCKSKPFMIDFILNMFIAFYHTLITNYRTGIAFKPYPNTLLPLLIKRVFNKSKIVVDIDDIDFGYRDGFISSFSRIIQKPFPKYFDMVTYHNELLKDFIISEYGVSRDKLYKLLQGVDFGIFDYKKDIKEFKKNFYEKNRLKDDTIIIGYPAHLNIASDLEIILKNISEFVNNKKIFILIAGGGPLLEYYKSLANNLEIKNIYFTGYLTPDEIVKYILISNYIICYYKDKNVNYYRASMKLRECLSLRKKIICNNVGELKYFDKFTYQSEKTVESLIERISQVIEENPKDDREILGYEFIKENADWDKIGKEFLSKFI